MLPPKRDGVGNRAYYRCTHKYTRACGATKQVQKTEDDPLIFEVTYRGNHTCMGVPNSPSPVGSLEEKTKNAVTNLQQQLEPKQNQKQDIPFKFEQGLKVETEEIHPKVVGRIPSFSFPSTSIQSENQDIWDQLEENNILAGLESPSTTESNYFSGAMDQVLTYPYDLSDMISTPTSGTNSLFHFDMDPIEFNVEPNVPFNVLDYITTDMIY
ncbi:hypothetical protein LIER_37289 [Lithospermum erythrorhizon]|uniref:WRKY domain-containing protein n=1 Tax=Lithospermum erythrorhizon TaxID=34254 RepID=A0AAV3PKL8_LITER